MKVGLRLQRHGRRRVISETVSGGQTAIMSVPPTPLSSREHQAANNHWSPIREAEHLNR